MSSNQSIYNSGLSNLIGIGFKNKHYSNLLSTKPDIGWLEIHAENYFYTNNRTYKNLKRISDLYQISIHGVALSLGSKNNLIKDHLLRVKKLISDINPIFVSEHLSWSTIAGKYVPDLLPVPYTHELADIFIKNIKYAQDFLGRQILLENPSSYFEFSSSYINEPEFLVYIAKESDCKILLDVNNIYVSCTNHNWDPFKYIDIIIASNGEGNNLIKEIHLAGHSTRSIDAEKQENILVDTHSDIVCSEVWDLYSYTVNKIGLVHTLVEWDEDIPDLDILLGEANKAKQIMEQLSVAV